MSASSSVEIRPEVAIYAAFARLNYRPWYALAEFVDNALQSYLASRDALCPADGAGYRLLVSIDISEDRIEIRDNAAGIAGQDFPRAFLPASPPPDTTGLSEFGLGMKAAACWFSKCWTVRTSALGDATERTITYNIPAITRQHLERLPVTESPAGARDHYTVLTLESLNVQPKTTTLTKIKRHLASIYRMFLRDGSLELRVDGELLAYAEPAFLEAPRFDDPRSPAVRWRRDFSLELDEHHRIWGWAGLLNRASVASAGFAVFRRRRLIEGSYGEAYRPETLFRKSNSYTYQRLVGELNVEGFSVSHTKDGVQWDEWEEDLLAWLRGELNKEPLPLLNQAEGHRARPSRQPATLAQVATDTQRIVAQRVPPLVDAQLGRAPEAADLPAALPPAEAEARREADLVLSHGGQRWRVSIELISDESVYQWVEIATEERRPAEHFVQIRVNVAHPFIVRFCTPGGTELTAFVRLGAALAISEITARAAGTRQAGTVRRNLNELLHDALAGPVDLFELDEGDGNG
jgi:hypothetical protein